MARAQQSRAQANQRRKRVGLQWGIGIVAAFGAILLIAWAGGAFGGDDSIQSSSTTVPAGDATLGTLGTLPLGGTEPTSPPNSTPAPPTVPDLGPAVEPVCPPADGSATKSQQFTAAPEMCIDPAKTYTAEIESNIGNIKIDLLTDKAPATVNNFVFLSRYHYYDGIQCHRIIPDFMAQCGDPTATGTGNPGYSFDDELPAEGEYQVGSVAMANSGPNTNGGQFFIITGQQGISLPPSYALFGQLAPGQEDIIATLNDSGNPDQSSNGMPPAKPVSIESVQITES